MDRNYHSVAPYMVFLPRYVTCYFKFVCSLFIYLRKLSGILIHLQLECLQLPGDLIFVPSGYEHAVLNTRASMGIIFLEFTIFATQPLQTSHQMLNCYISPQTAELWIQMI